MPFRHLAKNDIEKPKLATFKNIINFKKMVSLEMLERHDQNYFENYLI